MEETGCAGKENSLLLLGNGGIRNLNRIYLGRDRPTNVISFSLAEGEWGGVNPHLLGDIVISVEQAAAEAQEGGISFEDAVDFLVIHGLLHLLGYDHEGVADAVAEEMERKEKALFLAVKGYPLDSAPTVFATQAYPP
jgi:probable rRNA maturation factor